MLQGGVYERGVCMLYEGDVCYKRGVCMLYERGYVCYKRGRGVYHGGFAQL